ncbi:MAG: amidohydrolase family protein [Gemmatimonadales bacterium]
MLRVRAGWVHPVAAPPIADGAVLIDDGGRIAAVGPQAAVPAPPGADALAFPDGALVPGLVNCHTHLELTHLAGRTAEPEFARWIRRIRELKDATPADEFRRSAERGVRDAWARGITCVADTGSTGAPLEALARLGGRGIYYQEVFGPDPRKVAASMAEVEAALTRLRPLASSQLRVGVSPHAPYTVSAPLYRAVADVARRARLPVAVHLAESREETLLIRDGSGPFADALRARDIPVEPRRVSPVQYLVHLGVLASGHCLCIHCVHVGESDVARLVAADAAIVHCPRSNQAHGHGAAPMPAFRAAGLPIGLGTDSVASVADLDLWAEAAAAGLAGGEALRALTWDGARALGWERQIGSLEVGKAGDCAVFTSPVYPRPTPSSPVLLTIVAGRIVHRAGVLHNQ